MWLRYQKLSVVKNYGSMPLISHGYSNEILLPLQIYLRWSLFMRSHVLDVHSCFEVSIASRFFAAANFDNGDGVNAR